MKQNKTLGIILLVMFGLSVLGGIVNGTFANLGGQNPGYYLGLFGGMGAMLVIGLLKLFGKK